jgi:hypothetical protein
MRCLGLSAEEKPEIRMNMQKEAARCGQPLNTPHHMHRLVFCKAENPGESIERQNAKGT